MTISNDMSGRVSFDGSLGLLIDVSLIDDNALEIRGQFGNLIVEITKETLQKVLNAPSKNILQKKESEN